MTIYEQIRNALNYIETRLFSSLTPEDVAAAACMPHRSLYNYFRTLTGYTCKEYVIKRRLSRAVRLLAASGESVLEIALTVGYESREAFTRAFKKEFGITPAGFRKRRPPLGWLGKITLVEEVYMGVVIKELPEMHVVCFEGFAPEPERKAFAEMRAWLEKRGLGKKPHRVFGHNIDARGNMSYDPVNEGCKVLVAVDPVTVGEDGAVKSGVIAPGRFVVTGIEGSADTDGEWIMEGWRRLNELIEKKEYAVKKPARWFEEVLEPSRPGNLRLDLYLKIERKGNE